MKRILTFTALLTACALSALTVQSAPLKRSDVINEPLWVVHVDADALRQTVIGQYILDEMAKPEAQKKLAAFQAVFNFDPRKELHGVTLYGTSRSEEDGVLLLYADFDSNRLTTLAEGAKEHESTGHGKHTIHSWIDEKKKAKNGVTPRTYAAINGKVIIFAQKESRVAEALDVLDKSKPNLGANTQFSRLGESKGFIQGAARKLDFQSSDPNAALLKQSKMLTLTVQETQKTLNANLALEADSDDVAKNLENVARGLIGLLSLQKEKPEAQKLAQGLSVQQDGPLLTTKLSLPSDQAIEIIKAGNARKAAHKKETE